MFKKTLYKELISQSVQKCKIWKINLNLIKIQPGCLVLSQNMATHNERCYWALTTKMSSAALILVSQEQEKPKH